MARFDERWKRAYVCTSSGRILSLDGSDGATLRCFDLGDHKHAVPQLGKLQDVKVCAATVVDGRIVCLV